MADMVQVRRPRANLFAMEPQLSIGRSQFDRSHMLKIGFDADYLYPIFLDEVLPGDTHTMDLNGFARITHPLDAPLLDNIELETFFFFVPTRLVWTNWVYFQGEHDEAGAQDTDYTIPILSHASAISHDAGGVSFSAMLGYMGLPDGLIPNSTPVSALPPRCYNLIYTEWFRDQNLIDEPTILTGNGPDDAGNYPLRKSAKKHDYFTSALPYLQKGSAQSAALTGILDVYTSQAVGNNIAVYNSALAAIHELDSDAARVDVSATVGSAAQTLKVDLSDATGIDINTLRQTVAIQRLLERDARGGTRYTEIIKSHFGVTSPDFRLQRPEYLGGGKCYINVNPVAATTGSGTGEEIAQLKAYGTGVIKGHGWAKSFTEHGYILGLVRARGDITYFQGVDRLWTRSTRYDFYMPALAHLGEQSIYKKELFVSNDGATTDNTVFGYQERWAEYRYKPSRVVGNLNPDSASALSFWHLAEDFASAPSLNQTFIEANTPMDRVTTTDTGNQFLADIWFNYKSARPIPVHSIPSLMDRRF